LITADASFDYASAQFLTPRFQRYGERNAVKSKNALMLRSDAIVNQTETLSDE
jgi:hypothetical protein